MGPKPLFLSRRGYMQGMALNTSLHMANIENRFAPRQLGPWLTKRLSKLTAYPDIVNKLWESRPFNKLREKHPLELFTVLPLALCYRTVALRQIITALPLKTPLKEPKAVEVTVSSSASTKASTKTGGKPPLTNEAALVAVVANTAGVAIALLLPHPPLAHLRQRSLRPLPHRMAQALAPALVYNTRASLWPVPSKSSTATRMVGTILMRRRTVDTTLGIRHTMLRRPGARWIVSRHAA